jgi:hypothetical protein
MRQLELENQKFDYFVRAKAQTKKCEFDEFEDSLVKDMIVLGTRNNSVRERLLTKKDLELGKAVTIYRSAEQAHEQVQEMTMESKDESVWTRSNRPVTNGQAAEYRTATSKGTATTREDRNFLLQSMCHRAWPTAVSSIYANNVEDVIRMIISAGCGRCEALKVNNQE